MERSLHTMKGTEFCSANVAWLRSLALLIEESSARSKAGDAGVVIKISTSSRLTSTFGAGFE